MVLSLLLALFLQGAVTCDGPLCWNSADVPNCPDPHGDAIQKMAHDLNAFKNNVAVPDPTKLQVLSLGGMLAPGDDSTRYTQGAAATVEGYVLNAKPGGVESCNCHATDPAFKDTHIELGLTADPQTPGSQRVIVEVTPHTRKFTDVLGGGVSTAQMHALLVGHKVRVTGWLFFDAEHRGNAENTHPGSPKNWRVTCWEIHPVTGLTLIP
jgi:hypothetical protein